MGGKTDILTTDTGKTSVKRLEFTLNLHQKTRADTRLEKLKNKYFSSSQKPLAKSTWKTEMGTTPNDYEAGERYIQDLKETGVLTVEDHKNNAEMLKLHHNKLIREYFKSSFFQENLKLNVETIQKQVKGRTVSHEVYIENDFPRINKAISKIKALSLLP